MTRKPDARWAFAHHLPKARRGFPLVNAPIPDLSAVIARHDGFVRDAFGVLNMGGTVIRGAGARIARRWAAGKKPVVLTNGACPPQEQALTKYHRRGLSFLAAEAWAAAHGRSGRARGAVFWGADLGARVFRRARSAAVARRLGSGA